MGDKRPPKRGKRSKGMPKDGVPVSGYTKQPKDSGDGSDKTIKYCFTAFDNKNWRNKHGTDQDCFLTIAATLRDVGNWKWGELYGSRSAHHAMPVSRLDKTAQDRLIAIGCEDDTLYEIHVSGKKIVWGYKSGEHLMVLWWDPDHVIYPVAKKHT